MSTFGLQIVMACGLLAPAQAEPAKPDPVPAQITSGTLTISLAGAEVARPAVAEDIEVMRALLRRKLGPLAGRWTQPVFTNTMTPLFGNPLTSTTNTLLPNQTIGQTSFGGLTGLYGSSSGGQFYQTHPFDADGFAVEGAYLDGYGVVFTVTMPAAAGDPRPKESPPPPAPLSEWDRERRQLRGESVQEPKPAAPQQPPLGEVLLRLLAENGKHFGSLRADERLTVVVTFRGHSGSRPGQPVVVTENRPTTANVADGSAATLNVAPPAGQTARDLELLGELHLKQQKYPEAEATIRQALSAVESDLKREPNSPEHRQERERLNSLYSKLAQVQLANGKLDEARATLEKARRIALDLTGTTQPTAAAKPAGPHLPARLIVSAAATQLARVGAGQMSLDEFRKAAKVEFYPAAGGTEKK